MWWTLLTGRTPQPLDSAKVRFSGGAAAIATCLEAYLRHKGVSIHFDCTVKRVSMEDDNALRVEALKVIMLGPKHNDDDRDIQRSVRNDSLARSLAPLGRVHPRETPNQSLQKVLGTLSLTAQNMNRCKICSSWTEVPFGWMALSPGGGRKEFPHASCGCSCIRVRRHPLIE